MPLRLLLNHLIIALLLCFILPAHANSLWQANKLSPNANTQRFSANTALLKERLWQAPAHQIGYAGLRFELPINAKHQLEVEVFEDSIFAENIAKQYPEMRSFRVHEKNTQRLIGRIDFNTSGFHAMLNYQGQTFFIQPTEVANAYNLYSSNTDSQPFTCQTLETPIIDPTISSTVQSNRMMAKTFASQLREYRFALSASHDYHQAVGNGNLEKTHAEMIIAVSRVNFVFERDLSLRLELVSDRSLIASANELSGDLTNIMSKNAAWIQLKQPGLAYDIGHVLTTIGGGIATFESACTSAKAQGATGLPQPKNDIFYIEYLAHELAHQLGASHTFNALSNDTNSACDSNNWYGASSYEPGSGSTIMSYAGLCTDQNLQSNSDHYFHGFSIQQIRDFVESNPACGTDKASGDLNPPNANAGSDYTIPANTPFVLQGSATDADGDSNFSYTWEQMDLGPATADKAAMHKDSGQGTIIRSRPPSNESFRIVPPLNAILQANLALYDGERLANTNRQLNFKLTVRSGSHGVDQDDMRIQVLAGASPFAVTSIIANPQTGFTATPITWQVADTHLPPISCGFVDIALSIDGGQNFDTLLDGVKNNGHANVVLPNTTISQTRLRVKCSNNIFFAISHPSFAINEDIQHRNNTAISIHAIDAERYEGTQGASTFRFLIKRTGDISRTASVDYTVVGSGENPADEDDFAALQFPQGRITFLSGEETYALNMDIQADTITEPTENFTIRLSNASADHIIAIDSVEATIYDGAEPIISTTYTKKSKSGSTSATFTLLLLLLWVYRQSKPR